MREGRTSGLRLHKGVGGINEPLGHKSQHHVGGMEQWGADSASDDWSRWEGRGLTRRLKCGLCLRLPWGTSCLLRGHIVTCLKLLTFPRPPRGPYQMTGPCVVMDVACDTNHIKTEERYLKARSWKLRATERLEQRFPLFQLHIPDRFLSLFKEPSSISHLPI